MTGSLFRFDKRINSIPGKVSYKQNTRRRCTPSMLSASPLPPSLSLWTFGCSFTSFPCDFLHDSRARLALRMCRGDANSANGNGDLAFHYLLWLWPAYLLRP